MRALFFLIIGVVLGWGVTGFFTSGFETDYLFILMVGLVIGHSIGRRKGKEEYRGSTSGDV
ncbi:hypothetical protein FGG79_04905 [Bacillus sp. BHET2]|uniref:hypothetical protein n=1 Tax=Bacillus sp. BHET2 TaxID=2583818 RepID=UPI00110DCDFE|nr:hypothetical protein [Bacillus sp. BHET2]TMU87467.1 hypothetical protein FGG79_04905 [Bacillus sp. BHET2]